MHPSPTVSSFLGITECSERTGQGSGGGVLTAVREEYSSEEVPELQTDCEIIWTKINLKDTRNLYICSFYNPKTSDEHSLAQFEEALQRARNIQNAFLFIGGDFNYPGWDWKRKVLKEKCLHSAVHNRFAEVLDDHGLVQLVEEPTRNNNTLDLMLTNFPAKVLRIEVLPGVADHDAVFAEVDTRPVTNHQKPRKIPLYKKANWDSMKQDVQQLQTQIEQMERSGSDVNCMWDTFQQKLDASIAKNIPHKTARSKDGLPWMTTELKKLIKKCDRLYKKKKKSANPKDIEEFKAMKHLVQKKLRQAYWTYVEDLVSPQEQPVPETPSRKDDSSKRFWTFIKHKKSDNAGIAGLKENGRLKTDSVHKANILNRQFQSVFTEKTSVTKEEFQARTQMKTEPTDFPDSDDIIITCAGVEKLLRELNPYKGSGPDNIKPRVLKELAKELAPVLTCIFRTSYRSGTVPDVWREALITPVYKKGQKYKAENYRPISLTCICCKLMEHIVTSHIMKHAEEHSILYPLQHGFRKNRSCETQLLEFIEDVTTNMEEGKQTDVLIMDFSKAFDKVSHSLLLHKLDHYGIRGKTNKWIQSFLSNRSQRVVVDGYTSDSASVESGVPQGSVLGPSLFLFYINDIAEGLNSTVRLFADDTIAYLVIITKKDCQLLQTDLDKMEVWEGKWLMEFHLNKCQVLSITRKQTPIFYNYILHGQVLEHVQSAKYLGCTINKDLDWAEHIQNITNKANGTLAFLRRNLNIGSTKVKSQAYHSFVRPILEYSSTVWDPHHKKDVNRIEMVQRRAARYVTNRYRNRSSVGDMLEDLEWENLERRRQLARLAMLYKIDRQLVAVDSRKLLPPVRRTRNMHPKSFQIPSCNTDYRKWSFFPRTIREWNNLPPDLVQAGSPDAFKAQVAKHFSI